MKERSYLKIIGVARGGAQGARALNWNAINDKNLTKEPCFFIFNFF